MTMVLRLGRHCLCPFPLACILHVVLLTAAAALGGNMDRTAARSEAEVVLELTPEEAAVRDSIAPAAPRSWTDRLMSATQERAAQDAAVDTAPERGAAAVGAGAEEALLPAAETTVGHDAAAAGSGSQASAGGTGSGETAGATGSSAGPAGEADTGVAGGQAEVGDASESAGSIAARFAVRVEQRKEYPYMAVKRGLTGVVTVGVTLGSDGSLQGAYIAASSGSPLLDESALTAVRHACPFPHGAGCSISLQVPIVYELD